MAAPPDVAGAVELPGPWQHRYVAANGARFHVVEAVAQAGGQASGLTGGHSGSTSANPPLVLLLHGFPEFWWAWREQLPMLAAAGYRAVAMDLRGYGGSDKTPRGYDPFTLAQDVAGVVKGLGGRSAILVGHGWGGYVAWTAAMRHPGQVSALCAVSSPHPLVMLRTLHSGTLPALRHLLAMQPPWVPERRVADPSREFVRNHLRAWRAPGSAFPDAATASTYQQVLGLWPSSHCALEYHRWLIRSRLRADGRAFNAAIRQQVNQPVCVITGDRDPVVPERAARGSAEHVDGGFTRCTVPGAGHFPHEERPEQFDEQLLGWLETL